MQTYTRLCQAGDKKDGKLYLDGKTIGSLSYGDPKFYLRASECHRKTSSVGDGSGGGGGVVLCFFCTLGERPPTEYRSSK
jgi:hypothetical protein